MAYPNGETSWGASPQGGQPNGNTDYRDSVPGEQSSGSTGGYHPYVGSHPYDDGYVKPSGGGLGHDDSSGGSGLGYYYPGIGYVGIGGVGEGTGGTPNSQKELWSDQVQSDPELVQSLYNGDAAAQINQELLKAAGLDAGPAQVGRVEHVDIEPEKSMLDQITEAQKQQAELQINNAVQTGTTELQRTMQDAQSQFQQARNQIDVEEQRAKDNQVLYAEARGDRGGVGQAQYNTIQNTAATNRLTVQSEQTKLATDTARQITDLRAQGEFEKANQLLSITQNYLSQLMNLYTWAKETNLGVDEFNIQVSQWEENYKLSLLGANLDIANATGVFANGTPTYATWKDTQKMLAESGQALLEKGIPPTAEQLLAMGMTTDQADRLINDKQAKTRYTSIYSAGYKPPKEEETESEE